MQENTCKQYEKIISHKYVSLNAEGIGNRNSSQYLLRCQLKVASTTFF